MDNKKPKEGLSVREIEEFAKQHRFEVFFCLMFLLSCIFAMVGYFKPHWNIFFAMGGSILGVIFPAKVEMVIKKVFSFVFKQEKTLLMVLGGVSLVFSIFLPILTFLCVGLFGGRAMHQLASDSSQK